jgi:DDE superfamily endonuclease
LIFDGHGSHVAQDLLIKAHKHDVFVFCLPPHCTHQLQPLDVGIFGPFQSAFSEGVNELVQEHKYRLTKAAFVTMYLDTHNKTFSQCVIRKAFQKCGINPLNPDIFPESSFRPSQATSTRASLHLPPSFPMGSEEWDLQSASHNTESDTSSNSGEDITTSLHDNLPIPLMTPTNSQQHDESDHPTPQHTHTATPHMISSCHIHTSSSLSKERLINIALTLCDEKEAAKADADRARAHAAIVGHKYTQLQQDILARERTPKASRKSFATTAHIMNTAEALNQIEVEKAMAIADTAKKDELKQEKEDNA